MGPQGQPLTHSSSGSIQPALGEAESLGGSISPPQPRHSSCPSLQTRKHCVRQARPLCLVTAEPFAFQTPQAHLSQPRVLSPSGANSPPGPLCPSGGEGKPRPTSSTTAMPYAPLPHPLPYLLWQPLLRFMLFLTQFLSVCSSQACASTFLLPFTSWGAGSLWHSPANWLQLGQMNEAQA